MKFRHASLVLAPVLAQVLAASLCAAAVPTPESHFGHRMGADRKLLDWSKVVSYFQSLERSSDRIRVAELGKTTGGRPYITATISSPETLQRLDYYRGIQARLADPRKTTEAEAEKLIAEGKTVVMITCSIHSTEVASTSTAVEFAYKLITEDNPKFKAILANTIFILVPSQNPDGVDIVTQWYRKTLGTPYEGTTPPELYQKYVGHDNNRDWYIFSQDETRLAIGKIQNVWHPQIVYDVHQQGPNASRMFVPPWLDPVDPNIDPIIAQLCNSVGATMAADLTAAGMTGVAINALYDFWTPARHYQAYHGGLRILSESASARLATPIVVKPEDISNSALGYNPRERSWNYLEPWTGGEWHQRDIVDYQLVALESCLYQAAIRRTDFLRSFYRIGQRALARTTPDSFVISSNQLDSGATRKMLETLAFGEVEIHRASGAFRANGKEYPDGSYVIPLRQPYGSYAKTLLERQNYPDLRMYPGGPPRRPYDVTAQTLPLLMGVTVDTIDRPFSAKLSRAVEFGEPAESTAAGNIDSWRTANTAWASGKGVWRNPAGGDFSLAANAGFRALKRPRIGLYKSYIPNMDEGWTRWLLDQFGFAYTSVLNKEFQADDLRSRFDVIIFADQRAAAIESGYRQGAMPEEYTGGLGEKGAEALKHFASQGGTLVFLNEATEYALEHLGVDARNALQGLSNKEFYSPGSLLNVRVDTTHPLMLGLPRDIAIWSEGSPAFEVPKGSRDRAVATYTATNVLASGWLLGEKYLVNRPALLDVPMGSGHIILFGMRPQYRAQSYQAFKIFFNALLYFE
ncbi:MAG: M14 metallopeptidase family protein [Bryobacteraceae bacterium]